MEPPPPVPRARRNQEPRETGQQQLAVTLPTSQWADVIVNDFLAHGPATTGNPLQVRNKPGSPV